MSELQITPIEDTDDIDDISIDYYEEIELYWKLGMSW